MRSSAQYLRRARSGTGNRAALPSAAQAFRAAFLAVVLTAATPAAPTFVVSVQPAAGSVVSQVESVRATLDFRKTDGADPTTIRLLLDGEDVTAKAKVAMTRDWPPSAVEVSYRPVTLAAGPHTVEVRFHRSNGLLSGFSWHFRIAAE